LWCSNPEGQKSVPEVLIDKIKCRQAGNCEKSCHLAAIKVELNSPVINRELCDGCGDCVTACPNGALTMVGEYVSVEDIMREIRKDEPYYRKSGGGLTLTGGEPLIQADFARNLLKAAKGYYIDTAIETCGHVSWSQIEKVLPYTNTFLYDIKQMDPVIHKTQTGLSNNLILENAKNLAGMPDLELVFRTPIIPGKNDSSSNLKTIADFALALNINRWEIFAYHKFGEVKYDGLEQEYELSAVEPPSKERMQELIDGIKPVFPGIVITH
jgi:pyruvate formate lyase activating enzyme